MPKSLSKTTPATAPAISPKKSTKSRFPIWVLFIQKHLSQAFLSGFGIWADCQGERDCTALDLELRGPHQTKGEAECFPSRSWRLPSLLVLRFRPIRTGLSVPIFDFHCDPCRGGLIVAVSDVFPDMIHILFSLRTRKRLATLSSLLRFFVFSESITTRCLFGGKIPGNFPLSFRWDQLVWI